MSAIEHIIETGATAIESVMIAGFITWFLGSKLSAKKWRAAAAAGVILIDLSFASLRSFPWVPREITAVISVVIFMSYALIALKGKPVEKLFIVLLTFGIIAIVHVIVPNIISQIVKRDWHDLMQNFDFLKIFTIYATKILCLNIFSLILLFKKKNYFQFTTRQFLLLSAEQFVFMLLIFVMARGIINTPQNQINQVFLYVSCVGVLIANVLVFLVIYFINKANHIQTDHLLLQQAQSYQQKYVENAGNTYKKVLQMRHDLRHNMQAVRGLALKNDMDGILEYTSAYSKTMEKWNVYVETGNPIIDAIINQKIDACKKANVNVVTEITYRLKDVSSIDVGMILANLFDNALEASSKLEESAIFLTIAKRQDYLFIQMKNPIGASVLQNNPKLLTSKEDTKYHGFGTRSIRKTAQELSGMAEFYEKGNMFVCQVLIKL